MFDCNISKVSTVILNTLQYNALKSDLNYQCVTSNYTITLFFAGYLNCNDDTSLTNVNETVFNVSPQLQVQGFGQCDVAETCILLEC